jgi:hypothetical protein
MDSRDFIWVVPLHSPTYLFHSSCIPHCKNFRAFNRGTRTRPFSETGRRAPVWTNIIYCVCGCYHRLPGAARHSYKFTCRVSKHRHNIYNKLGNISNKTTKTPYPILDGRWKGYGLWVSLFVMPNVGTLGSCTTKNTLIHDGLPWSQTSENAS